MGCGQSKVPPDQRLVGVWVSSNLAPTKLVLDPSQPEHACIDEEAELCSLLDEYTANTWYKLRKDKSIHKQRLKEGMIIEIRESGWVRYLHLKGTKLSCYSGPITSWHDDHWIGMFPRRKEAHGLISFKVSEVTLQEEESQKDHTMTLNKVPMRRSKVKRGQ